MPGLRTRGREIRKYILEHVEEHPRNLAAVVAGKFGISPQAVRIHLNRLTKSEFLAEEGSTKDRSYSLRILQEWTKTYAINPELSEHEILDADIQPRLSDLPTNVQSIWQTAFTEMFNNIIDHSGAAEANVEIRSTAVYTEMAIHDNGIGIFKKIQEVLKLPNERAAVVELSKGKFTTDPSKHSGEGVFFTSKMFDRFDILSGGLPFSGDPNTAPQWVKDRFKDGTTIWMKLAIDSPREPKDVYDQFTEEFAFVKTAVPIRLAQSSTTGLVSRSQAKRILSRIDKFKVVALDFTGVEWIGQGFADEIFRVYKSTHPDVEILVQGTNAAVQAMIEHAKAAKPIALNT
jgi:anti-sigma regulatory factor (Ser/Thr protein kinase)/23S rRNA pseudoU1915 N3-methylase RlmH